MDTQWRDENGWRPAGDEG